MRVGIVGAGAMGRVHAPAWAATGAELVGVMARRERAARPLAAEHRAKTYTSYDALLGAVDVIDLCVPTDLHHSLTLRAAEAGVHVVCEKPVALTLEHAREMAEACERAGVRLFVAMVLRFFPQYRAAAELVHSGRLGELGVLRLKRVSYPPRTEDGWYADEARSGGMLLDLMIHDFDYAHWLAGDVARVFAKSVRSPHAPKDYALVTLRFKSGAMALLEGGWVYPPGAFRTGFDVAGKDGLIEWHSDGGSAVRSFTEAGEAQAGEVGLPPSAEDPYTIQIRHVHHALSRDEPFAISPEDAVGALELALAARRSLETGRPVTLEEP